MKNHLTFVNEYMTQVQRRLVAETSGSSAPDRAAWSHSFQDTLSEHLKALRRMEPLPGDSGSGEMVSMMQQYSDLLISMVHQKMAEPKKWLSQVQMPKLVNILLIVCL